MTTVIYMHSGPATCSICGTLPCKHFELIPDIELHKGLIKMGFNGPHLLESESYEETKAKVDKLLEVYEEFGPEQVKQEHETKLKNHEEDMGRL